ncbi:DUF3341 domain-containing protein [Salinisphaera aquimarina]|uniref:DUF3341 domain-containing protein n=1 Tax=Salinisphaera aquimarina TaxID=2094031 RepID=A0ABV7ELL1_9GAMM
MTEAAYGWLARFEHADALLAAARTLRADGVTGVEAYTPYPVEGLGTVVGGTSRGVALWSLISGAVAGLITFFMQWYSAVYAYPFVVGGKPLGGWPAFMPATAAMVMLFAVIGAWIGMLVGNRLPQPYHPAFNVEAFARASSDGFFLLVERPANDEEDRGRIERRLRELGAASVDAVPA